MNSKPVSKYEEVCQNLFESCKNKNEEPLFLLRKKYPMAVIIQLYEKFLLLEHFYNFEEEMEITTEESSDILFDIAKLCILEIVGRNIDENEITELELTKKKLDETLRNLSNTEAKLSRESKDHSGLHDSF